MQFDPLKLFIMCRRDAVLRSGLTQLWQLLRDGRHHAREPAGVESISNRQVTQMGAFSLRLVRRQLRDTVTPRELRKRAARLISRHFLQIACKLSPESAVKSEAIGCLLLLASKSTYML